MQHAPYVLVNYTQISRVKRHPSSREHERSLTQDTCSNMKGRHLIKTRPGGNARLKQRTASGCRGLPGRTPLRISTVGFHAAIGLLSHLMKPPLPRTGPVPAPSLAHRPPHELPGEDGGLFSTPSLRQQCRLRRDTPTTARTRAPGASGLRRTRPAPLAQTRLT